MTLYSDSMVERCDLILDRARALSVRSPNEAAEVLRELLDPLSAVDDESDKASLVDSALVPAGRLNTADAWAILCDFLDIVASLPTPAIRHSLVEKIATLLRRVYPTLEAQRLSGSVAASPESIVEVAARLRYERHLFVIDLSNGRRISSTYGWNDALARYFFRPDFAGRRVVLNATKEAVDHVGATLGLSYEDFIASLRTEARTGRLCENAYSKFVHWRDIG